MVRILLIVRVIAADHSGLQAHHHIRVIGVVLAAMHILQETALIERLAPRARTARHLPLVFFQLIEGHAANTRRHASKGYIDQFAVETDRFKQLGAAIRVHRRDAHLGHDFQEPLIDALAEVFLA